MRLYSYLRNQFSNKIIPFVIKDKCEICGRIENLEVHHIYRFKDILNDTLEFLNLEEKDTAKYTEIELRLITNLFLGEHLRYKYQTVCNYCHHNKIHGGRGFNVTFLIDEDLLGVWNTKGVLEEFVIVKNNMRDKFGRVMTVNKLKGELEKRGYIMEKKRRRVDGEQITMYRIITNEQKNKEFVDRMKAKKDK